MNIFLMHLTYPGQFLHLAPYLASNPENNVYFFAQSDSHKLQCENITTQIYKKPQRFKSYLEKEPFPMKYPIANIDSGLSVVETMDQLRKEHNIQPDIIIGHIAWGSLFFCKDIYPHVPIIGYFEVYPRYKDCDYYWFPGEVASNFERIKTRTRQAKHLLSFDVCDAYVTASKWQHSQFPEEYKPNLHVIHEGIDTKFCSPDPSGKRPGLVLDDIQLNLPEGTEIITYISRGFEPLRGFSQFMDSIRIVLANRPNTHVIVVGKDQPAYGAQLKDTTYLKEEEKKGGYPVNRVHFVGRRDRVDYRKILRASSCHVYLTRPFVLSWSCLEAMSFACPMVCSKTPPVEEVMTDGVNGLLANFRSPRHIARKIEELLDDPELAGKLGAAARETILERYDVIKCVRLWEDLMYSLVR